MSRLASTPWPRFRFDPGSTGHSSFSGPINGDLIWEKKTGKTNGEPVIGNNNEIYLPLKNNKLLALTSNGEEIWKKPFYGYSDKPLQGLTTPLIREDGSIIVCTMRKITCLEPDGEIRWEKYIDGFPTTPNISNDGRIYVSAWSLDWAGMYIISADGESTGLDDPSLPTFWRLGRKDEVAAVSIDSKGNIYLPYRKNITHPEAYTWDPPDEVEEEFFYECAIYDRDGNNIERFIPNYFESNNIKPTFTCIGPDDTIYYFGGGNGELYVFTLPDLQSLEISNHLTFHDFEKKIINTSIAERWDAQKEMMKICLWSWDKYRDRQSKDQPDSVYLHDAILFPVIGDGTSHFNRVSTSYRRASKRLLQFNTFEVKNKGILHYYPIEFSSKIYANPIMDGKNNLYIGSNSGKIDILRSHESKIGSIKLERSINSLIIGPEQSLIVTTKDGYLSYLG